MARTKKSETVEKPEVKEAAETPALEESKTESVEEIRAEYEKKLADMQAAMTAQLESIKAQMAATQMPQIVQVSADVEKVRFLWMAPLAEDNVTMFGQGGMYARITGPRGEFLVPKPELSRVMDHMTRYFLDKRWLIVISGLNDEEREALGVDYKDGELLDRQAFAKMVELEDEILSIYPALCDGHKEMVAKRYYEAWCEHNPHIHRDVVLELKRMAQDAGIQNNTFADILAEMNTADAKTD